MGQKYDHLSYEDRVKIEHWHKNGKSIRYIAGELGRSPNTISYELKHLAVAGEYIARKASVKAYPGVGSSYSLSWKAPDGRMLNYTLRTEAGEGPLALLKLRNFRLPETIFSTTGVALSDPVASATSDTEEVY